MRSIAPSINPWDTQRAHKSCLSRLFGVFGYFGSFGVFGESGRWVYWVCCVIESLSQLFKATLNVEHRTHLHIHASTHPAGSKELQDSSRNWS